MGEGDFNRTGGAEAQQWLVTGAAGFIGCNLCRFLLEHGAVVIGIDNFFSGRRENIERLKRQGSERFRFVEATILDSDIVGAAMKGCEYVAHLAAQVSVQRSMDDPWETHEINSTGFLNVLTAAQAADVRHFVYASSCAVYGDNPNLPLSETERPSPMSPYAATKLANEDYAAGFVTGPAGLAVTGLRFFNIFGAWQDVGGGYTAVIPKWIDAFLTDSQPILYGDGSAVRDFCHVDNVCEAIWAVCQSRQRANHSIFNIGTGKQTRLDALFGVIRQILTDRGSHVSWQEPQAEPWRPGDILESVADVQLARSELGFEAKVGLEEGIRRMVDEEYGHR